ncbi:hypothetical protein Pfo_026998 [Paulownia fortunei]|nr:hypothetical protein Pfo_026998 [Paulownia fortunei]
MENRTVEWEILNYSPPLEDGDTDEKNKLGWILNTGLSLGKKLVITGVVISSVPLVLPPLVVISALGCAFSVPFGVLFASYACTEKLMSKLLPSPAQSRMLDYETYEEEEQVVAFEKEEEEQWDAIEDGIEIRIELVDGDVRNEQESLANRDKFKVGDLEEKDDEFLNNVKVGGLNNEDREQRSLEQSEDEKPSFNVVGADTEIGGNATKTDDYAVVAPELGNAGDKKSEVQNNVGSSGKDVTLEAQTDKFMENEGEKNVRDRKERVKFSEDKNEKVEKTVTVVKGTEKDKKRQTVSKGKSSSKETERRGKRKTLMALKFPGKRKEPEGDKKHEKLSGKEKGIPEETETSSENKLSFSPVVEGKFDLEEKQCPEVVVQERSTDKLGSVSSEKEQAGEQECIILGSENLDTKQVSVKSKRNVLLNDDVGNIDSSLEREQKPVGLKEMWKGQIVKDDAVCNACCEMNDETNMGTGVLASETAEDVFANERGIDEKIEQRTMTIYSDPGENYIQSGTIADDGECSLEIASLTSVPELKHDEEIPELKEEKDACAVDSGLHSDEGSFLDEKIWKKIDAIRVIVGFKAPRRPSYFEELKALYLFTGIEPPSSSSMDPSDSTEFYNKLCFLMSVIGLK